MSLLFGKKSGPQRVDIPEQVTPAHSYYTCMSCKHYNYRMVQSGNHPKYQNDCSHPLAWEHYALGDVRIISSRGGMSTTHTPDWCPYLRSPAQANFIFATGSADAISVDAAERRYWVVGRSNKHKPAHGGYPDSDPKQQEYPEDDDHRPG